MKRRLGSLIGRRTSLTSNDPAPVERRTHFADQSINDQMATDGYAVLPERLDPASVTAMSRLYDSVRTEVGEPATGCFTPSMTITRPDLRSRLWDGVMSITAPVIDPMFEPGMTQVMGGSFVLKPAAPESARNPHQDPSTFDESTHVGISIWIPLSDSTEQNGTLHLLRGSHRMANDIRPPEVANFTDEVTQYALSNSVAVELERGQMLVIDGAVVHHSPPNCSQSDRVACIVALRPVGAPMALMRSDRGAVAGMATLHEVDVEMFRSGNLMDPDLSASPRVRRLPYAPATMTDLSRSLSSS